MWITENVWNTYIWLQKHQHKAKSKGIWDGLPVKQDRNHSDALVFILFVIPGVHFSVMKVYLVNRCAPFRVHTSFAKICQKGDSSPTQCYLTTSFVIGFLYMIRIRNGMGIKLCNYSHTDSTLRSSLNSYKIWSKVKSKYQIN